MSTYTLSSDDMTPIERAQIEKLEARMIEVLKNDLGMNSEVRVRLTPERTVALSVIPLNAQGKSPNNDNWNAVVGEAHLKALSYLMAAGVAKYRTQLEPSRVLLFEREPGFGEVKESFANLDALALSLNALATKKEQKIDLLNPDLGQGRQ